MVLSYATAKERLLFVIEKFAQIAPAANEKYEEKEIEDTFRTPQYRTNNEIQIEIQHYILGTILFSNRSWLG